MKIEDKINGLFNQPQTTDILYIIKINAPEA